MRQPAWYCNKPSEVVAAWCFYSLHFLSLVLLYSRGLGLNMVGFPAEQLVLLLLSNRTIHLNMAPCLSIPSSGPALSTSSLGLSFGIWMFALASFSSTVDFSREAIWICVSFAFFQPSNQFEHGAMSVNSFFRPGPLYKRFQPQFWWVLILHQPSTELAKRASDLIHGAVFSFEFWAIQMFASFALVPYAYWSFIGLQAQTAHRAGEPASPSAAALSVCFFSPATLRLSFVFRPKAHSVPQNHRPTRQQRCPQCSYRVLFHPLLAIVACWQKRSRVNAPCYALQPRWPKTSATQSARFCDMHQAKILFNPGQKASELSTACCCGILSYSALSAKRYFKNECILCIKIIQEQHILIIIE